MTPERWVEVQQLCDAALARSVDERAAFLAAACDGDTALRREVESLVALAPGTAGFLSTPALALEYDGAGDSFSLLGRQLGPYAIYAELGAGGMGEVYRARDARLGRDVAIKILPPAFTRDPDRLTRFEREARVLAALNHPNIGAIYALEAVDGVPALILELVEGHTLAERLGAGARRGSRLPLAEALTIARQIVGALEAAHDRGVVHRDLKPANVKVTPAGIVKVLDFGLAKAAGEVIGQEPPDQRATSRGTRDGTILGTTAYMSPEQARGEAVDKRSDIWSFGCVLFEMLAGQRPFGPRDNAAAAGDATHKGEPVWHALPAHTPEPLRRLLRRCLETERRRRLADIADARLDIDDALTMSAEGEVASGREAGRPWIAWSGCVAAIAVALVVAIVHWREEPAPAPAPVRFVIPVPTAARLPTDANFSLSPDGNSLVFLASGPDGLTRLWLLAARDALAEGRPLAGTEITGGDSPPFWAPDSRRVAFESEHGLKTVDLTGSPPERICDVPGVVLGGSWNRDGVIIFGTETSGVMKVSAGGGVATSVTTLDRDRQERVHGFPTFLPDGRHFLYSRLSTVPENSGVYVGALDEKSDAHAARRLAGSPFAATFVSVPNSSGGALLILKGTTLTAQPFDLGQLRLIGEPVSIAELVGHNYASGFYAASIDTLIYRNASGSRAQLTWFDRTGTVVATEGEPIITPDTPPVLSPRADHAALVLFDGHSMDIWIAAFGRGLTRLTSEPGLKSSPVWSPNGSQVAYSSSRAGHYDLYQKASNGDGVEDLLFASDENKYPVSWSADGRFLLFQSESTKTALDLKVLPMHGGPEARRPFAFAQTTAAEGNGRFSPDARWVAYTSNESGRNEIYVRSFTPPVAPGASPAGGKWLVSRDGGMQPHWTDNSRMLFYLAPDGGMMAVDVAAQSGFAAGVPRRQFQLPLNRLWDSTAHDPRFLFAMPLAQATPPFTVVRNWQRGLKEETRGQVATALSR
ncbi:MAG: protein kinase [Acidobacteriota bacterium]